MKTSCYWRFTFNSGTFNSGWFSIEKAYEILGPKQSDCYWGFAVNAETERTRIILYCTVVKNRRLFGIRLYLLYPSDSSSSTLKIDTWEDISREVAGSGQAGQGWTDEGSIAITARGASKDYQKNGMANGMMKNLCVRWLGCYRIVDLMLWSQNERIVFMPLADLLWEDCDFL